MTSLRRGDHGPEVAAIRATLASLGLLHRRDGIGRIEPAVDSNWAASDAVFDSDLDTAVRAFQQNRGLIVDGLVGETTQRALREASYKLGARVLSYHLSAPLYGDDVAELQQRLQELGFYSARIDSYFGPNTHTALINFQREYGLAADGICGPDTLRSIEYLGTRVTGGSPLAIREEEIVRRSGPRLSGKRIVLDPVRGGDDVGLTLVSPTGETITEAEILRDIVGRLEGRMTAAGMETSLSHPPTASLSETERANIANAFDADLLLSLHMDHHHLPEANGVATFHFGNSLGSSSMIGSMLAGFIQKEVVARVGLVDCQTHGRSWDLLRLTRMPTVSVAIGYATSPADVAVLTTEAGREAVSEALLIAVKRLYLLGTNDHPTGTYTFEEVLAQERNA